MDGVTAMRMCSASRQRRIRVDFAAAVNRYTASSLSPLHSLHGLPMPTVTTSAKLNCSAAALRSYLGATANLPKTSDPELQLEVLNAPADVVQGGVIEFRVSALGFKQRMQHRYVSVTETEIVAEQTDGPTRSWTHKQLIEDHGDGTCTLTDEISFEKPGGMLGFVMTDDRITESIEEGMEFRYEALQAELEAG